MEQKDDQHTITVTLSAESIAHNIYSQVYRRYEQFVDEAYIPMIVGDLIKEILEYGLLDGSHYYVGKSLLDLCETDKK